jgi:hypothetical protein
MCWGIMIDTLNGIDTAKERNLFDLKRPPFQILVIHI